MNPATIQTANDTLTNASASFTQGMGNATGLFPVIAVVFYLAVLAVLVSALTKSEYFERAMEYLQHARATWKYFVDGFVTLVGVGVLFLPAYAITTLDSGTRGMLGLALLGVVVLYAGITLIGYVSRKVLLNPLEDSWDEYTEDNTEVTD